MLANRDSGIKGYGPHVLRIGYFVPRRYVCVAFSCLATLRVEGMSKQYPLAAFLESPREAREISARRDQDLGKSLDGPRLDWWKIKG